MCYNFNSQIERSHTNCIKYDFRQQVFGDSDILPMWIADMDIAIPDFIIDAVKKRAEHPVYGYSFFSDTYYDNFIHWMYKRHGLRIEREWICFSPGVVPALNMSVLTYTRPKDKIIIQPPVYPPFFNAVIDHDRLLVENCLHFNENRYTMDYEDLERIIDTKTKMIILCNPHNPVGRCWEKDELEKLMHICDTYHITLISDEIHSDLIVKPFKHCSLLSLTDKVIACFSPSKTFNLAGMSTSMIVIPDKDLREQYQQTVNGLHIGFGNLFGGIATEAAYCQGEKWYQALWKYLQENIEYVIDFCQKNIPEINVIQPQATYLLWLDCRMISNSATDLQHLFVNELKLGLNNGNEFGGVGEGFMRMNVACPRKTLETAMERLCQLKKKV